MFEKLNELNISINNSREVTFNQYIKLFLEYNRKVNLISRNDENLLFEKHIYDSLAVNLFIEKYAIKKAKILDIGTGGGFPSVPMSIIYKNFDITAIDSINKKINFIKYLKDELNIANINPICKRAEELNKNSKYDIVVSRAMAELRVMLEYAIPYLNKGGYFIAYKSIKADEEISAAKNALSVLNSKVIDKIEYKLPINNENKRVLIVIQKEKETANIYPRQNGLIKKKPL